MNSTTELPLTGLHLRTHQTIFQHPISHNLAWRDVYALLRHLCQIEEEPNGNIKVTRNGHSLLLHPERTKDVGTADEVVALQRFLEESEAMTPESHEQQHLQLLLVIDHHEARLFRTTGNGGAPEIIMPHTPDDYFRHAPHSKEFSRGQEKPDPSSFFEPVAKALQAADQILIFGTGTGKSSEMNQFISWAKIHHPELSKRIIKSVVIDEHHLTDGQLLALAKDAYGKPKRNHW